MKTEKISTNKKKFSMPHNYALLFGVIVICTILTWILPAGEFERVVTDTGRSVVVPGTFTVIESTPVGPFAMMQSMYAGIKDAASIIALVFLCCAGFGIVIGSGAVTAGINALIKKMGSKAKIAIIPIFMIILGAASSTFGMFEDTFPFIPLMAILAINMGYDAIVGVAIVALGIGMGYSGAALNPFTVGIAQTIAEVPLMSGIGFRLLCHLAMIVVASVYTIRYALKIEKDPSKSLLYGEDFSDLLAEAPEEMEFGARQKIILVMFVAGIVLFAYGALNYSWSFGQLTAIAITMAIITGILMHKSVNELCEEFSKQFAFAAPSVLMIGIARGILIVLQNGKIIDTIAYYASMPLMHVPAIFSGVAMLAFQTLLNFLIPSGSGQAVVSMPIMTPLADLLGVSREVAVLAFQFGDGLSNILWPTAFASIICGLAHVKLDKWWKWFIPLFGLLFLTQAILNV